MYTHIVFMYMYKYIHLYTHRVGTLYACIYICVFMHITHVYMYIYIITLFLSWVKVYSVLTLLLEMLKDESNIHLLYLFLNNHYVLKNKNFTEFA